MHIIQEKRQEELDSDSGDYEVRVSTLEREKDQVMVTGKLQKERLEGHEVLTLQSDVISSEKMKREVRSTTKHSFFTIRVKYLKSPRKKWKK